jgi:hypothetical protein
MNCVKCGRAYDALPWYIVAYRNEIFHFCSRQCLIEHFAPELKQAVVVKQWIPTPEDEERMHQ